MTSATVKTLIVVAVVFAVGVLVGMVLNAPRNVEPAPNPNAIYCQDALSRRALHQDAISRGDTMTRLRSRPLLEQAEQDVTRYCPPPR